MSKQMQISLILHSQIRLFSLGNFISTAEKIRLPDDCTIGYIIGVLLQVPLTHTHLFHSHLENLHTLPTGIVLQQVIMHFTELSKSSSIQTLDQSSTRFQIYVGKVEDEASSQNTVVRKTPAVVELRWNKSYMMWCCLNNFRFYLIV